MVLEVNSSSTLSFVARDIFGALVSMFQYFPLKMALVSQFCREFHEEFYRFKEN